MKKSGEKDEDFPFMLYTGKGTEEIAQEAIKAGITDYFQKQAGTEHYGFIANRVQDAVTSYREEERSEIFRSLVDITDRPVIVSNTEAEIVYVNSALEEVSGYSGEELVGNTPEMLLSEQQEHSFGEIYTALCKGEELEIEGLECRDKDGNAYFEDKKLVPIAIHGEDPEYFVSISQVQA